MTLRPKEPKGAERTGGRAEPIAWWKLDEAEGASATDATGHGHAGRFQGTPRRGPSEGHFGGALELGTVGSFVNCGLSDADFRDALTVSVWFKVRKFDKPLQALVTKGSDSWRLQRHGEQGTIDFALTGPRVTGAKQDKPPVVVSKRSVDDGQWHHAVAVYDGKLAALYLDGELEQALSASGPIAQNTEPVLLGENASSRGRTFNGWLDDVRLYDRALTAEQVRALFGAATAQLDASAK